MIVYGKFYRQSDGLYKRQSGSMPINSLNLVQPILKRKDTPAICILSRSRLLAKMFKMTDYIHVGRTRHNHSLLMFNNYPESVELFELSAAPERTRDLLLKGKLNKDLNQARL